jgi:hypothetical protein
MTVTASFDGGSVVEHTVLERAKVEASIAKLEAWVEAHQYKGYDPSDGLNSFLRPLTFATFAR